MRYSIHHLIGLLRLPIALAAIAGTCAAAGTATDISGLYNTGLTSGGGSLQSAGSTDGNWSVTYASTNGGSSKNSSYVGSAYVISPSTVTASAYTANTSNAQWITAPGATDSSGNNANTGGDYLPGNGTGSNEGVYIYTLSFTITGTGSGTISGSSSQILISMGIAADDNYAVYVNPSGSGTRIPSGTASATGSAAWSNTNTIDLANYSGTDSSGNSFTSNATFKIGTNYIVIVVYNTNSATGNSTSTTTNASGLLVYQASSALINGQPVPEVAAWLPLLGALGFYGVIRFGRRLLSAVG